MGDNQHGRYSGGHANDKRYHDSHSTSGDPAFGACDGTSYQVLAKALRGSAEIPRYNRRPGRRDFLGPPRRKGIQQRRGHDRGVRPVQRKALRIRVEIPVPLRPYEAAYEDRKQPWLRGGRCGGRSVLRERSHRSRRHPGFRAVCQEHRSAYPGYRSDNEPGAVNGGCG